jgi:hypothetical protein
MDHGVGMMRSEMTSGEMLRRGEGPVLGLEDEVDDAEETRLARLARREGVGPLVECSEVMEALRIRAGVPERDEGATEAEALRIGVRTAPAVRGEAGEAAERSASLRGLGPVVERPGRGVLVDAGDEVVDVDIVMRLRDCDRASSPSRPSLA